LHNFVRLTEGRQDGPSHTESATFRGDVTPPHHMPDRAGNVGDHGNDHDFVDPYPGATRIQSIESTTVTFLVDNDMVPLKVVQLPGL